MEIYVGDIIKVTPLASIDKGLTGENGTCSVLEVIDGSDEKEIVVLDIYGDDWMLKESQYTLYERVNIKHEKLGYVLQTVKEYFKIELEEIELDSKEVNTLIGDAKTLADQIIQIINFVKVKKGMGKLIKELNEILDYTKDYINNNEKYKGVNIREKQLDVEEVCAKYNIRLYNLK